MDQWNDYFNSPESNLLGLISSSLFLPAIITPYIASFLSDRYGRKITLAIGSLLLIAGAFVNAFAKNIGTFIAGRVLVGAAGPFGKITAVALLHEIAHPRLRPIVATSFYCKYLKRTRGVFLQHRLIVCPFGTRQLLLWIHCGGVVLLWLTSLGCNVLGMASSLPISNHGALRGSHTSSLHPGEPAIPYSPWQN